jgi:hypothetical protein
MFGRFALIAAMAGSVAVFGAVPPHPGVLNYIEGNAALDGSALNPKSVGSAEMSSGQVLTTQQGKAEILLTPGVLLRLGDNSSIRMISPGLTDTRVQLLNGRAMVEAADIHNENNIRIQTRESQTTLLKNGVYGFDADRGSVAVYDGKATVSEDDRSVEVKGGREVNLNAPLKAEKFDKKAAEESDPLYAWSKVRSEYLSQASAASAQTLVVNNYGWLGGGWYWNPWFSAYSFLPGSGLLYSPFGWGFYSPFAFYGYAPVYRYPRFHRAPHVIVGGGRVTNGIQPHIGVGRSGASRGASGAAHGFRGGRR